MPPTRPLILDCDPGHDDALALAVALARPELRVLRERRLGRIYLHVTTHEAMGRSAPPAWQEPHYCLGAPLARLELQIAFTTMPRRVPKLELVEAPTWKPTYVLRGLVELRVRA